MAITAKDVRSRALTRQSLLIAGVCVLGDGVGYLVRGPERFGPVELVVLVLLLAADAALATSPKRSGWVAAAQALLLPALALVAPGRTVTTAGLLVSAYRAGAWLRGPVAALALALLGGALVVATAIRGPLSLLDVAVLVTANTVLPWLVGRYTTGRKEYVDELRHQRELSLRDAEEELARALARERETIAADLHDVISHHVSAVGVHAAAARMRLGDDIAASRSLGAVETSSRAAMTDLRRLLELLHGEDPANQPGLAQLPELFAASGLEVSHVAYDDPQPVDPDVDLALYRTVQEMLTNARRYGDGSPVRVELEYADDQVILTARNRTGPSTETGTGRGLAGIARRAALLGGTAESGPVDDGKYWRTSVAIPREPRT